VPTLPIATPHYTLRKGGVGRERKGEFPGGRGGGREGELQRGAFLGNAEFSKPGATLIKGTFAASRDLDSLKLVKVSAVASCRWHR
jgi:hypothetical protein